MSYPRAMISAYFLQLSLSRWTKNLILEWQNMNSILVTKFSNVRYENKYTKRSSVLLLRLVLIFVTDVISKLDKLNLITYIKKIVFRHSEIRILSPSNSWILPFTPVEAWFTQVFNCWNFTSKYNHKIVDPSVLSFSSMY